MKNILSEQKQFFELAKEAKRLPNAVITLLALIGIFVLSAGIAGATTELFFGKEKEVYNFSRESYLTFSIFSLMIFFVFIWIKLYEKRGLRSIGFVSKHALKKYLKGFALGVILICLSIGLMLLTGSAVKETSGINMNSGFIITSIIIALLVFIIQGAGEEVLFRGWLMQTIGAKYKPWIGMLVSLLIFTAMHLGNNGITVLTIINLILYTLILILYILNEGSLWGVCGFHSSWNWTVSNVFGIEISGSQPYGGSIINLKTSGNELLSGGIFGPEASIFTTIILVVVLLYFLLKK